MYKEKLIEFLDNEVSDYSWKYEIEFIEEYKENEYYTVKIYNKWDNGEIEKIGKGEVDFKVSENKIEVSIYEDNYQETEYYDWTVKYFWIALLNK